LAAIQADKDVPLIHRVVGTLLTLWKLFFYSPPKAEKLKAVQNLLNTPQLKMVKPSDTRWLAIGRQAEIVLGEYPALITALDNIYEEDGDAAANGCARLLCQFDHLASVHLINEALKILNILSIILQGPSQNVCKVTSIVDSTTSQLNRLINNPAWLTSAVDRIRSGDLSQERMTVTDVQSDDFHTIHQFIAGTY
jgi:hypothetical protein